MYVIKHGNLLGFPSMFMSVGDVVTVNTVDPNIDDFVTYHGAFLPVGHMRGNPTVFMDAHAVQDYERGRLYSTFLRVDPRGNLSMGGLTSTEDSDNYMLDDRFLPQSSNFIAVAGEEGDVGPYRLTNLRMLVMSGASLEELNSKVPELYSVGGGLQWHSIDDIVERILRVRSRRFTLLQDPEVVGYDPDRDVLITSEDRITGSTPIYLLDGVVKPLWECLTEDRVALLPEAIPLGYVRDGVKFLYGLDIVYRNTQRLTRRVGLSKK